MRVLKKPGMKGSVFRNGTCKFTHCLMRTALINGFLMIDSGGKDIQELRLITPSSLSRLVQSSINIFNWFKSNPIILREFIRYSRRFRFWGMMAMLLIASTLILCLAWSYNLDAGPTIPVGRRLFYALIAAELAVIVLLLPGIVSHSLITEREQDTYPLLLTTPLPPGKIIAGKLISTLGVMVLLIVSTFPLIGICVTRGGVSPRELIAGPFYLVLSCFVVASFSIYNALNAKTTFQAIFLTHLTLFLAMVVGGAALAFWLGILYSTLGILVKLAAANYPVVSLLPITKLWFWSYILLGTILAVGLTFWLLRASRSRLSFLEPTIRDAWDMRRTPRFYFRQGIKTQEKEGNLSSWWNFTDEMNPFYVRERLAYAALSGFSGLSSWYVIILLCHFLFLLTPISGGKWVAIVILLAIGQMVPAYAGPLFAREKEQNTWEMMLTTICQARGILHGKMLGALSQCLPRVGILFCLPFITAFLFFTLLHSIHLSQSYLVSPIHVSFYGIILFVQMIFILSATTCLSLLLPKTGNAISAGYILCATIFAAPYLAGFIIENYHLPIPPVSIQAISPLYMIRSFPLLENRSQEVLDWFRMLGWHVLLYLSGAFGFYCISLQRLKRLQ